MRRRIRMDRDGARGYIFVWLSDGFFANDYRKGADEDSESYGLYYEPVGGGGGVGGGGNPSGNAIPCPEIGGGDGGGGGHIPTNPAGGGGGGAAIPDATIAGRSGRPCMAGEGDWPGWKLACAGSKTGAWL